LINKKTVFVLGAGASCPYGYPSGALLRERIVLSQGLWQNYTSYNLPGLSEIEKKSKEKKIRIFIEAFDKASIKSIDLFIANNPKLSEIGKYIIAFEILSAEQQSLFGEKAKFEQEHREYLQNHQGRSPSDLFPRPFFLGGDWYSYMYNRLIEGLVGKNALPDFSNGNLSFITFNYDRSLEYLFCESLSNSFTEVPETDIITCLRNLKILHVYGQIALLRWQNPSDYVDYKPPLTEPLLQRSANNVRTIYEEKQNPELTEAQVLLKQAEQIFFLGFGYAQENMEILNLIKTVSPVVQIYGTAFNLEPNEINSIQRKINKCIPATSTGYKHQYNIKIENIDCLKLLRNYL
jgi:hypothetical protein